MADIHTKPKDRLFFCWRCGYRRYEFTHLRKLWEDRARCFFCRIDALDKKYGPGMFAELSKRKDGSCNPAPLTRWELSRRLRRIRRLLRAR